jgi:large subunit ribosomal protein L2
MFLNFFCNNLISSLKHFGLLSKGGRNFLGRICVRGRGGKKKRIYKFIDFFRRVNLFGVVLKILYDCNRTCLLALIMYKNGVFSFIPATENLNINDLIYSGVNPIKDPLIGWACPVKDINLFTIINNIELIPFKGSKIVRAAGTGSLLIGKIKEKVLIKLNSCWELKINQDCMGSIGQVSNSNKKYKIIGSAGKARNLGFRPKVRGVAMNPCDHPHGGGNGKHSPPVVAVSAYGRPTKGTPTKNKKKDRIKRRLFKKIL